MKFDYLITGLPRSGTAWASNLMSFGYVSFCFHEFGYGHSENMLPLDHNYRIIGDASSGLLFKEHRPSVPKLILIERDVSAVVQSLRAQSARHGVEHLISSFDHIEAAYQETKKVADLTVNFRDLFEEDGAERLWKFALGENTHFPVEHFHRLRNFNVQLQEWIY